jgi:hypothetical protein
MLDLAELFREAASRGYIVMVPPGQQRGQQRALELTAPPTTESGLVIKT